MIEAMENRHNRQWFKCKIWIQFVPQNLVMIIQLSEIQQHLITSPTTFPSPTSIIPFFLHCAAFTPFNIHQSGTTISHFKSIHSFVSFTLTKPCMPGRNISILLNLIYFENLFRDIGFSSSYCFVPVYLTSYLAAVNPTILLFIFL